MAKKLYVGGLPYSTTDDQLKDAFAQAGAVESSVIIMDKMSGRSKGFGFVEMSSDSEAQSAIDMWNGKDFGGRTLTVNEARPMEERPKTSGDTVAAAMIAADTAAVVAVVATAAAAAVGNSITNRTRKAPTERSAGAFAVRSEVLIRRYDVEVSRAYDG